jgi:putative hydrolase of the HAD superfamily
MIIKVSKGTSIVFDLDDTLFLEIDFLRSAFRAIAREVSGEMNDSLYEQMYYLYKTGGNAFSFLLEKYKKRNITLEKLLYLYRNHYPDISLREGVMELLLQIKKRHGRIGIITDGRRITQLNKIKALGLEGYIDEIVISEDYGCEKPSKVLFDVFMMSGLDYRYFYIGDNLAKDFVTPKKLGWTTIGVLDSLNIHKQDISEYSDEYLPDIFIKKFDEIGIV